jgi:hypothetical protein
VVLKGTLPVAALTSAAAFSTLSSYSSHTAYKRRYYRHKETGVTLHLADVLAKIDKGDRIERGLALTLTELATDNSYEKSSKIACNNHVSRQSVMKKTRAAKNYELEKEPERREVKEIHIQVDEDHVAMQNGKSSIVKLAVVHEPRKQIKSKAILPNKMHFASHKDKPEDFWCKVSEGIIERYGNRDDLKVYIHGDGASWIKTHTAVTSTSSIFKSVCCIA